MKFLSRLDDFESIIVDGNVQSSGLSSLYIKDSTNAILRIGNTTGDSFITYDGSELSISSDLDLRLTTPTDQDVFLITSSGNIVTTQGGGTFTIGGGLTLENFGAGYLKTDANGVVSIDTDIIEDTLDSVTDRNAVTTNAITVGGLTVNSDGHQITVAQSDGSLVGRLSYTGTTLRIQGNDGIRFEDTNGSTIHGIITDAGLWGIGTTNPGSKLVSQISAPGYSIVGQHSSGGQVGFYNSTADNGVGTVNNYPLNLFTNNSAPQVTLTTGGNVGIGTTSPNGTGWDESSTVLHIYKNATNGGLLKLESSNTSAILNAGDNQLAIFTTTEDPIRLGTNGSERMRITSAGNVGIGTTNPTTLLEIKSTTVTAGLCITAANDAYSDINLGDVDDVNIQRIRSEHSSNSLLIYTNNNEQMRINSAGNVGIGTAAPDYELDVVGSIKASVQSRFGNGTAAAPAYSFDADSDTGIFRGTTNALAFSTAASERMRIDASGNVGIGTTSPAAFALLDLKENTASSDLIIGLSAATGGRSQIRSVNQADNTTSEISFHTVASSSTSEKMRITSGGSMLMGLTSSTATDGTNVELAASTSSRYILASTGTGGHKWTMATGLSGSLDFYDYTQSAYRMRIDGSGNLQLTAYTAGLLKTDASGNVSLDTTSYSTFSGDYGDLTNTPTIPVSGTDFDPVGTDNSTNVTLAGSYDYLTLSGQEITLGQVDYSTDISNTPTIPVSGTDFDPVGTDNSTNVTLATVSGNYLTISGQEITAGTVPVSLGGTGATTAADARTNLGVDAAGTDNSTDVTLAGSYDYLTLSGQEITLGQIDYDTDITNTPTLGTAAATAASDYATAAQGAKADAALPKAGGTMTGQLIMGSAGAGTFSTEIKLTNGTYQGGIDYQSNGNLRLIDRTSSRVGAYINLLNGEFAAYNTGNTITNLLNTNGNSYFNGGNVGIGTTSPDRGLTISRSNQYASLNIYKANTTNQIVYLGTGSSGTDDDAILQLFDEATEKVRIFTAGSSWFNGGNVGIGTTNPYSGTNVTSLDINATAYPVLALSIGGTNVASLVGFSNSVGLIAKTGNFITLNPNDTEAVRITSAGNVGIGTDSPSEKLHVAGGFVYNYGAQNVSGFKHENAGGGHVVILNANDSYAQVYTTTSSHLVFGTSNAERMRITSAGNVGIGTTSPSSLLTVAGNTDLAWTAATSKLQISRSSTVARFQNYENGSAANISFQYDGGNVGIGTTSPVTKLNVEDNDIDAVQIRIKNNNTANGNKYLALLVGGTTGYSVSGWANSGVIESAAGTESNFVLGNYENGPIIFQTNNRIEKVRITSAGNVGIGTTSPGEHLSIEGTGDQALSIYSSTTGVQSTARTFIKLFGQNTASAKQEQVRIASAPGANASTAGQLIISTNNTSGNLTERLRIDENGNVGIGTTSPIGRFHINNADSAANQTALIVNQDDNAASIANFYQLGVQAFSLTTTGTNSGVLLIKSGGSNVVQVSTSGNSYFNGGNVGIGTTSPGHALDVNGNIRVQGGDRKLVFNNGLVEASLDQVTGASAGLFTIANVGVGTTSPATKLHVVGTAETRLRVGSSNASSNVVIELRDENSPTGQGTVITYNNATGETYFNNALSSATTDFHFQSGEYGSASDFFTLSNSGGNSIVQLSTTTGDSFITYEDATNELAIASDGDLRLTTPTDQDVFFISSGGNINMTQAGGVVDMGGQLTVDGNGIFNSNVGIGVSPSSSYKLAVNTSVGQTGALTTSGSVYIASGALGVNVAASATAGRIDASNDIVAYQTSDKRLKENIKPIENALDKVKSLTGVEFDWIEETKHVHGYDGHDVGVIAQEVQAVLPEAIRVNDTGYLSVRYEKMIALLVEGIKEQQAQIDELKARLDGAAK